MITVLQWMEARAQWNHCLLLFALFSQVINFYMNLLVERSKAPNLPSVHTYNTFFFVKLRSAGYSAVRRWTKTIDIFSMDILLVPVHLGMHWCLSVSQQKGLAWVTVYGIGSNSCYDDWHFTVACMTLFFSGGGFPQEVHRVLWFHGRKQRRSLQDIAVSCSVRSAYVLWVLINWSLQCCVLIDPEIEFHVKMEV